MSSALFVSHDNVGAGEGNTSQFRVHLPRQALLGAGHDVTHQAVPPARLGERGTWVDTIDHAQVRSVVLVERDLSPQRNDRLRLAGAQRVVLTFDDNYALMPSYSGAAPYWRDNLDAWLKALPLADLVIVPSERLADDYYKAARHIRVVRNYHDPALWCTPASKPGRPIIGWGGSVQHLQSWTGSGILPALKSVLADFPGWELVVCGSIGHLLREAGIPHRMLPWQSLPAWAETVKTFSLGLAPLYGSYDARRSNLKVVEYGLAGVPFVASEMDPYLEDLSPGGALVRRGKWEAALRHYLSDDAARESAGAAGKRWAQKYTLEKAVPLYEQVLWPR